MFSLICRSRFKCVCVHACGGHENRNETEKTMERTVMAAQGEMGRKGGDREGNKGQIRIKYNTCLKMKLIALCASHKLKMFKRKCRYLTYFCLLCLSYEC